MTHVWEFSAVVHAGSSTRVLYVCSRCRTRHEWHVGCVVGTHGVWAFAPSAKSELERGILPDCDDEAVKLVMSS